MTDPRTRGSQRWEVYEPSSEAPAGPLGFARRDHPRTVERMRASARHDPELLMHERRQRRSCSKVEANVVNDEAAALGVEGEIDAPALAAGDAVVDLDVRLA